MHISANAILSTYSVYRFSGAKQAYLPYKELKVEGQKGDTSQVSFQLTKAEKKHFNELLKTKKPEEIKDFLKDKIKEDLQKVGGKGRSLALLKSIERKMEQYLDLAKDHMKPNDQKVLKQKIDRRIEDTVSKSQDFLEAKIKYQNLGRLYHSTLDNGQRPSHSGIYPILKQNETLKVNVGSEGQVNINSQIKSSQIGRLSLLTSLRTN